MFIAAVYINIMDEDNLTKYQNAMESILSSYDNTAPDLYFKGPAQIKDYLFLGDFGDSHSIGQLSELGVTHLLNCAGIYTENSLSNSFGGHTGRRAYLQLEANDNEEYDMMAHYTEAESFIDEARNQGGNVLVYCVCGVNRSAAICTAYLIAKVNMDLCNAVETVASARGMILTNPGFRRQLVHFAHDRGLLEPK